MNSPFGGQKTMGDESRYQKIGHRFSFPFGKWAAKGGVYFIGIGGIGMSALARFFHSGGVPVSGYDRTESSLTKELEKEGIPVHYQEDPDSIPRDIGWVVYTPAVPEDHKELVYYRQQGYRVIKRSEVLEVITNSSFNICVAGTHGKTTITTMIAHVLRDSGFGCNAFLGGISVNYGTNFWSSEKNICVVEADEYDRSFLKLKPDIAVISAIDPDHLDIYGTAAAMEEAFIAFSGRLAEDGLLLQHYGLARGKDLKPARKISYDISHTGADAYATDLNLRDGIYAFDVMIAGKKLEGLRLQMGGIHNVENAVAAIAATSSLGIEDEKIRKAIGSFRGVKRRFEYIRRDEQVIFIDDYAHHPAELEALIRGARDLFPERALTVIFQPHLYSRTRDLADGFARALDLADETILLPIYPARELPIPGVSSEMILERSKNKRMTVKEKTELMNWIKKDFKSRAASGGRVLITAGAGDIDGLVEPISNLLKKTN